MWNAKITFLSQNDCIMCKTKHDCFYNDCGLMLKIIGWVTMFPVVNTVC